VALVTIDELLVADPPDAWEALGFHVDGDRCRIGAVTLRLAGAERGRGIVEWSLRGASTTELAGLPTRLADRESEESDTPPERVDHPNGALQLDHVVVSSGDFDHTVATLEAAGLSLRRIRDDGPRPMAFFRLGEVILELVQGEEGTPAEFWGLVAVVSDLDRLASQLGERLGAVHDAVQPGRRIASLQDAGEVSPALAFMSAP
jgi:hypothetical protein